MAKQYNPQACIVVLGVEDKAVNKLKKTGAEKVISPAQIGGLRMAYEMGKPSAVRFLNTILRQTSNTYRIKKNYHLGQFPDGQ